ncbi:MAG: hypothetical protein U1E76_04930 [Planctomycetota bacterium]
MDAEIQDVLLWFAGPALVEETDFAPADALAARKSRNRWPVWSFRIM